jgi:adenylate cyclase
MSDVFISYARSTEALARQIGDALRALGYRVWRDDELPAHRAYSDVIEERLKAARAVVVVWSAEAVRSHWVRSEADRAREDGKIVQVNVDGARLPMPFDQIQCADLSGWKGDLSAPGWQKAAASIADLAGGVTTARAPAPAAPPKAAAEPLLAVLAFDNLSGDPEMAYFSDGVSEEIQQTVARGTDLKVIGRTSSFQFRGANKRAAHVAAELKVTHLLDGSVRRSGDRVRISAQLVECASETSLWSDRFDRELTDIFALQDEIAGAVAEALKIAFAPAPRVGPIDPAAYDLYLRARNWTLSANLDVRPRIEALVEVIAASPNFAAAWALLADSRALRLRSRGRGPAYTAMRAGVVEAAETALRLDPASGVAYAALARLQPWGDHAEREALLGRALASAPNDPDCLTEMAVLCLNLGRFQEALRYSGRACEVDPLHMLAAFWEVWTGVCAGGIAEETHHRFEAFRTRWPQEEALGASEVIAHAFAGEWALLDEATRSIRRRRLAPRNEQQLRFYESLRDPRPEIRTQIVDQLTQDLARTGTVNIIDLADAYLVGLKNETFALVEQASFAHLFDRDGPPPSSTPSTGVMFYMSPNFEMATDIRFIQLCAKMGLCDYWSETGRWPDCADKVPYDFRAEAKKLAGGHV